MFQIGRGPSDEEILAAETYGETPAGAESTPDTVEVDIEEPEADTVEQHLAVDEVEQPSVPRAPFDADESDAADQSRAVPFDEDDYR